MESHSQRTGRERRRRFCIATALRNDHQNVTGVAVSADTFRGKLVDASLKPHRPTTRPVLKDAHRRLD